MQNSKTFEWALPPPSLRFPITCILVSVALYRFGIQRATCSSSPLPTRFSGGLSERCWCTTYRDGPLSTISRDGSPSSEGTAMRASVSPRWNGTGSPPPEKYTHAFQFAVPSHEKSCRQRFAPLALLPSLSMSPSLPISFIIVGIIVVSACPYHTLNWSEAKSPRNRPLLRNVVHSNPMSILSQIVRLSSFHPGALRYRHQP